MEFVECLVVDALTLGIGVRKFTRDFIGAGPRYVAGFIETISEKKVQTHIIRGEDFMSLPKNQIKSYKILCVSAMSMDKSIVNNILNRWNSIQTTEACLSILGGPICAEENLSVKFPFDILVSKEAEGILDLVFHQNLSSLLDMLSQQTQKQTFLDRTRSEINTLTPSVELQTAISVWFQESTGFPEKVLEYGEYKTARIYVECLRGCSNFFRTALPVNGIGVCNDSHCTQCREWKHPTEDCPIAIPAGCGFCSNIQEFGAPKSRSVSKIVSEIKTLISFGAKRIVLGGPDFLDFHRENLVSGKLIDPNFPEPNYEKLNDLISKLMEIPEIHSNTSQLFIENVKASLCTEKALEIMAKIPNPILSMGCETGSADFANRLGRPNSPQETLQAIQRAHNYGIRVHVYFIHSLPGEDLQDQRETLNFLQQLTQLNVEKITLYKYQQLPASPFAQIPQKYMQFPKNQQKMTQKIKNFIIRYNKEQKYRLIGKQVKVFLSEENKLKPNDAIGWILEGGPKVSVVEGYTYLNTLQTVKITQVLSDRLILGHIVESDVER